MISLFIEFTRPKKMCSQPLSRAIRLVEGTKYSHVRLRWVNSVGVDIVYEAGGSNVRFLGPLAQEDNPVKVLHSYRIELDRDQYRSLVKLCMENAGVDYGFKQIMGILLVRVLGLVKNPLSSGRKSQVCSEIVGRFLQDVLNIGHGLDLDVAGPREIKETLDKELRATLCIL